MRYTLHDVQSAVDQHTYERGAHSAAAGMVLGRTHGQNSINSQVMGSNHAIYHTEIRLSPPGQPVFFESTCNCALKKNCEHVVATLISSIRPATEDVLPMPAHQPHATAPNKWPFPQFNFGSNGQTARQVAKTAIPTTATVQSDVRPVPTLVLNHLHGHDYAQLFFDYNGLTASIEQIGTGQVLVRPTENGFDRVQRQDKMEQTFVRELHACGFSPIQSTQAPVDKTHPLAALVGAFVLPSESTWIHFAKHTLGELERQGWQIDKRPGYRFDIETIDGWYANITDSREGSGQEWFDLDLGIEVNQQKIPLLPVLVSLIRQAPAKFNAEVLAQHDDTAETVITLPNGAHVLVPWGRIKPILFTLGELYFSEKEGNPVRLCTLDAGRLAELDTALSLRWHGGERLLELGKKFKAFEKITLVSPPKSLCATLRGYQQEGLSWLQFLREYNLAGILADDMGLGKTLQTLAHILKEKEDGRLDRPALVVAPTSLMDNWQDEAELFAPDLRVLLLHGSDRFDKFPDMQQYDLVLTTFKLLHRDEQLFRQQQFHLVVLDESQNIKNAKTLAAHSANLLDTRHRLCLTGTPMENHLGELWSQFNFLIPGLLGDHRAFNRDYRKPIEKHGNDARRSFLVRRISPFLLRRTKDMVAQELPPKHEVVHHIDIADGQRDLYETIRLAMDKKVRDEIAHKGVARSQIVILEALLKLRQVCCDPRLVKAAYHDKANCASAKLEALVELVQRKQAEGRKMLIFSSFTSMLDIIGDTLSAQGVRYVRLDGSTTRRGSVIKAFQKGDVPVFLISLKAGGVGLNLTAADTVIHYDPWWNPAAENQATDRAYRIGQDKEVTVYKLITRGTVEEKIHALQQNKAELASSILSGAKVPTLQTTQDDLEAIFAPITDDLPQPLDKEADVVCEA